MDPIGAASKMANFLPFKLHDSYGESAAKMCKSCERNGNIYRCRSLSHMNAMVQVHAIALRSGSDESEDKQEKTGTQRGGHQRPPAESPTLSGTTVAPRALVPSRTSQSPYVHEAPLTEREPTKMVIKLNRLL